MKVAKRFIEQLQEGDTTGAIGTIKASLHERSVERIDEVRNEVLGSYGFTVKEAKMSMEEMEKAIEEMKQKYKDMEDSETPDQEAMEEMKTKMDEMSKEYEAMKKDK